MKRKIFIFYLILMAVSFLLLEIAARLMFSNPAVYKKLSSFGEYNSEIIWRADWVKKYGKLALRNEMNFRYSLPDPLYGWRLKPGLVSNEFNNKEVSVNSKGIRDHREFSYEKKPGVSRILIYGDSFTFGTEVGDSETYAHYLQRILPNVEVINMGVFGYGHDQMLLYLKNEGIKYHPDLVILGYLNCDDSRNLLGFRDYAKPRFVIVKDKLVLQGVPVPQPRSLVLSEFWRLRFFDLCSIVHRHFQMRAGKYQVREKRITDAILKEFVNRVRGMGAVPVFAYLEGIRDRPKEVPSAADKAFIAQWQSQGVPCFYLLPYVLKAEQRIMADKEVIVINGVSYAKRKYGHFSPVENEVIAEGLVDSLMRAGFPVK